MGATINDRVDVMQLLIDHGASLGLKNNVRHRIYICRVCGVGAHFNSISSRKEKWLQILRKVRQLKHFFRLLEQLNLKKHMVSFSYHCPVAFLFQFPLTFAENSLDIISHLFIVLQKILVWRVQD